MTLRRCVCPRQRINAAMRDPGQITMVTGLFFVLFLGIFLMAQLQLEQVRATCSYTEDALAASGLACALIDTGEYGRSHLLIIPDADRAYEEYCLALRTNLGLNQDWECGNRSLISGKVKVEDYLIYNVEGNTISIWAKEENGWGSYAGVLGEVRTPEGQVVEHTGIYTRITFPVKGLFGMEVWADMGKLVDIVGEP